MMKESNFVSPQVRPSTLTKSNSKYFSPLGKSKQQQNLAEAYTDEIVPG